MVASHLLPADTRTADAPGRPTSAEDRFAQAVPAGALRRVLDAHPRTTDIAVAVLLDVFTAVPLAHRRVAGPAVWLLDQALVLPLAFRRRNPPVVFAIVAVLACVQWLTGERLPADAALLLALYTVAAHQPSDRRRWQPGSSRWGWCSPRSGSLPPTTKWPVLWCS